MIHTPIVIARPTSLALLAAMVLACAAPRPARAEDRLDTETIDRLRDQIAAAVPRVESPPRIAFPEIAFGTRELDEAIAAVVHASSGAEVLTGRELDAYLGAQGLTPRVLERFAQESEPPQEPTESDRARHRLLTEQFGAILTGEVRAWRRSVPWERRLVVHLRLTEVRAGAVLLDRAFDVSIEDGARRARYIFFGALAVATALGLGVFVLVVRRIRRRERALLEPVGTSDDAILGGLREAQDRLREAMAECEAGDQEMIGLFVRGGQRRLEELRDELDVAVEQYGERRVIERLTPDFTSAIDGLLGAATRVRDRIREGRPESVHLELRDLEAHTARALEAFREAQGAAGA